MDFFIKGYFLLPFESYIHESHSCKATSQCDAIKLLRDSILSAHNTNGLFQCDIYIPDLYVRIVTDDGKLGYARVTTDSKPDLELIVLDNYEE